MSALAGEIVSRRVSLGGRLRPEARSAPPPLIDDDEAPAPSPETSPNGTPGGTPSVGSKAVMEDGGTPAPSAQTPAGGAPPAKNSTPTTTGAPPPNAQTPAAGANSTPAPNAQTPAAGTPAATGTQAPGAQTTAAGAPAANSTRAAGAQTSAAAAPAAHGTPAPGAQTPATSAAGGTPAPDARASAAGTPVSGTRSPSADPADGASPGVVEVVPEVRGVTAALRAATTAATTALAGPEVWSHRDRARLDERLADLPRTSWGRRGYDESAVDALIAGVSQDLVEADDQIDDLRSEVDRLHRYIRRQWAAVAAAEAAGRPRGRHAVDQADDEALARIGAHGRGSAGPEGATTSASPSAHARAVLTQAQEIAERRLAQADDRLAEADRTVAARLAGADATARATLAEAEIAAAERIAAADEASGHRLARTERMAEQVLNEAVEEARTKKTKAIDGARRLLVLARARYEDIIVRAHQRADHAAELALDDLDPIDGEAEQEDRERRELELKAAYLRTFAKVSRTALQAALDLSGREFEQLLGDSATFEDSLEAQDRSEQPEQPDAKVIVLPRSEKNAQSRPAALSAK